MRFTGMFPLRELYPHVDLGDATRRIDIHNAAGLKGIEVQVDDRVFRVKWVAENPLRSSYYGDYEVEDVTLEIRGVTRVEWLGDLSLGEDSGLIDCIQFWPEDDQLGTVSIVFETGRVINVSGSESELRWGTVDEA